MPLPKFKCRCGCVLSYYSVPTHLKSKKHKVLLELKEENDNLLNRLLDVKKELIKLK